MEPGTLALFDFDGTLTRGDSMLRFLLFAVPPGKLLLGSLVLSLKFTDLVLSGRWRNERAKEILLATFFKGQSEAALAKLGAAFHTQCMPGMLRPALLKLLREYRDAGAEVALVSASADIWLQTFCTAENIRLICTQLAFEDGKFSGKLASRNCNGPEKARRIRAAYDLSTFKNVVAYGNSAGDAAMFDLANECWMIRDDALIKVS